MSATSRDGKFKIAGLMQGSPAGVEADEKAGTGAEGSEDTDEE